MPKFHNPYHFVPVEEPAVDDPAAGWVPLIGETCERQIGIASPFSHATYCAETFSGRIICRLRAETELVIGGRQEKPSVAGPTTVTPFELGGAPAIPASSLRGMISSVFEAATGSALRVLDDQMLTFRKLPKAAMTAVGMALWKPEKGGWWLLPLALPTLRQVDGRFDVPQEFRHMFPDTPDQMPRLKVLLDRPQYQGKLSFNAEPGKVKFHYMRLDATLRFSSGQFSSETSLRFAKGGRDTNYLIGQRPLPEDRRLLAKAEVPPAKADLWTRGVLLVLGAGHSDRDMPKDKKHEYFVPAPVGFEKWEDFPILPEAVARLEQLAKLRLDQQNAAADATEESLLPYHPLGTRRNIDPNTDGHELRLKHGDLVWFRPTAEGKDKGKAVAELSFSSIWRGRAEKGNEGQKTAATVHDFFRGLADAPSPCAELLPYSAERSCLSPAEQVFGFVADGEVAPPKPQAHAGRVRFGNGCFAGTPAGASQADGSPGYYLAEIVLKELSSPKPPCPVMYFRKRSGSGYIAKHQLDPGSDEPQGRKRYLHARLGTPLTEAQTTKLEKIERLRAQPNPLDAARKEELRKLQDGMARHMAVRPLPRGSAFYFHVDFDNLTSAELDALCFALQPAANFQHKLGLGKPLGLGSVAVAPVGLFFVKRINRYRTDDPLTDPRYHESWFAEDPTSGTTLHPWPPAYRLEVGAFNASRLCDASGWFGERRDRFARVRQASDAARALLRLGDPGAVTHPVHYPPAVDGSVEGENFQWFVCNDGNKAPDGRKATNAKQTLRPLCAGTDLPSLTTMEFPPPTPPGAFPSDGNQRRQSGQTYQGGPPRGKRRRDR